MPGPYYEQLCGWVSHSTPQARAMDQLGQEYFYKDAGKWAKSFSNVFMVQIHEDYSEGGNGFGHNNYELELGGQYSWEEELMRRGGATKPIST